MGEEFAVPEDDSGNEFSDLDAGATAYEIEHAQKAEAKPETANEDASIGATAEAIAGKLGQEKLRGSGGGAHELAAIELQEVLAVVLVKGEAGAVRGEDFCQGAKWFQ